MKPRLLTKNEQHVLYGLVTYPTLSDSALSEQLNIKLSTLTSIKRRLETGGFFRTLTVPLVNRLDCELLAIIYTQFNPVIPLDQRVQATKKNIEIFDEIFFSVGEQEKGFSISLAQNYTAIGRINEIRTEIFGKLGLLEHEYPHEIIFPFETSHIPTFFDCSRLLATMFSIDDHRSQQPQWFHSLEPVTLTKKEQQVYIALVQHPDATTQDIGDIVNLSRHTVSRMKQKFFSENLLQTIVFPNLALLGVDFLGFSHIPFNPHNAPNNDDIAVLNTPYTILLAQKKFEAVLISAYPTFQEYKEDEMKKLRFLKENNLISSPPLMSMYTYGRMIVIKDFDFVSLTKKIFASS